MARSSQLLAAAKKQDVGLALQDVLNHNVNVLLAMARKQGKKYDRRDIVAALVFGGPRDNAGLRKLLADYEQATIASARLRGASPATELRRPGRIPNRGDA